MTTMTTSFNSPPITNSILYGGASVTGTSHIERELPNQDAIGMFAFKEGYVMVVADGVGSVLYPEVGSKAVVKAVFEATKIWATYEGAPKEQLLRLIHALFNLYIHEYDKQQCATTCLFAVYLHSGRLVVGQVGDGLVFLQYGEEHLVLEEPKHSFINVTEPITSLRNIKGWRCQEVEVLDKPFSIMLCSDGVSESIEQLFYEKFLQHYVDKITAYNRLKKRNSFIRKQLLNWADKSSVDDKSLVIVNRGVSK